MIRWQTVRITRMHKNLRYRKTESHLMEELNTLRQNRDEKIITFYNRVQSLLTRILNTFSHMNPTERRYRSDMIRDIALNRFTLHIKQDHTMNECYEKHPNRNQVRDYTKNSHKIHVNQTTNGKTNASNRQNKFCRYCKNSGHLIDECRKREYNNRKFQNQELTNSPISMSKNQMQKIHLNSQTSTTSVALVDNL
ncbi:hypothetical protein BDFB_008993 [Asbolus verrucosus]|uniref:CCHC-type domain-containing protein n=1 Tax=Asbolus verrucosus TaxID=1661398 RepID=A0A482VBG1_ASBVE|nr:hypothetical protein BDFB_008993 [Asbolus verrucosus]